MSYFEEFKKEIGERYSLQSSKLNKMFESMDESVKCVFENYLAVQIENGEKVKDLVSYYYFMVEETNRYQLFFYRNGGRYRNLTYNQIAEVAYNNESYMHKYMTGLAISTFLWPQHRILFDFYCRFIKSINRNKPMNYLEIGAGHGLYALKAMEAGIFDEYLFIDISEESLCLSKRMLNNCAEIKKATFKCSDFFTYDFSNRFDVISASEVIEAVEDPLEFLYRCREVVEEDGWVHISTPINSPMVDCIYLFDSKEQVECMIKTAGFIIEDRKIVPYNNFSLEMCEKKKLPVNVAYILKPV